MKKLLTSFCLFAVASSVALAGPFSKSTKGFKEPVVPIPAPCIDGGEFTLGLFVGYAFADDEALGYDDGFAGGVDLIYYTTPQIGIGLEYFAFGSEPIHSVSGVVQVRFPMDCFAPYIFGTAGLLTDSIDQFGAGIGAGFEYRVTPGVGVFSDGRYVFTEENTDFTLVRAGLRFVF
ncbi:MAG: hypothetical protein ACFCU3_10795 [Verrucomicrobiales bacterium]